MLSGEIPVVWRGGGAGENKGAADEAICRRTSIPASNTLLLRRTFPELEASLLTYFRRDVPRELYAANTTKRSTWSPGMNGSTTRFAYCHNENDVYQYQGAEYLFIGVDELTHLHVGAVAISHQPQSVRDAGRVSVHGRRDESREHRTRLGESAVGRQAARLRGWSGRDQYDPARLRIYSRAHCPTIRSMRRMTNI